jgi:hypothetical protein
MMNKALAMRPRWYGILLAGWAAGCTVSSPSDPSDSKPVPDHFRDDLDLITRGIAHPCGADFEILDGQTVEHFRYLYDALARQQRDLKLDQVGTLLEQIDYTWDNAGHLTNRHDAAPGNGALTIDRYLYDTLGRLTQFEETTSDIDPTDDHQNTNTRTTIDYTEFDALGHAAHSSELREDLDAQTATATTTRYVYDDLGRRTSLQISSASGDPLQSEQDIYDDVAHTVSWQLHVPPALPGAFPGTFGGVQQYDSDGHWLSTRIDYVGLDGALVSTNDTVATWDGDRELTEVTTLVPAGSPQVKLHFSSKTYQYQCDSARLATGARAVRAPRALPGATR